MENAHVAEYEVDSDAAQIIRWLKYDMKVGRRKKFEARATREYSFEPVPDLEETGIGEDVDIACLTTIATLEVQPRDGKHLWLLRVRVEDVVGSHLPEDHSVPEDAEEIDLDTFYTDFIAPDRGTVYVSLLAETPQAKHAFDRLLSEMTVDRHGR